MSKFGLTDERYNQMMKHYDNNESRVEEVVNDWGADMCNKGYDVFEFGNSNMLEVLRLDEVGTFEDDEAAAKQAIKDGVKLIPVDELPENFDRRYLGWIDTPSNREAIKRYCERNKAMLIYTDGYEITTEKFLTKDDARKEMEQQYKNLKPEDLDEEWADCSYINDTDAILYANGENVYVWKIVEI